MRLPLALAASAGFALLVPTRPAAAQPDESVGQSFLAPAGPNVTLQAINGGSLFGSARQGTVYTAYLFAFTPAGAAGGAVVGPLLFSQSLGTSFSGFTLTPGVTLVGGSYYALLLGNVESNVNGITGALAPDFTSGDAIVCRGRACALAVGAESGSYDTSGFSATFGPAGGPVSVAPEPGTWALLGTGLLAVGAVATRRRAKA